MADLQSNPPTAGSLSDFSYVPALFGAVLGTPSIVSLAQAAFDAGNLYAPAQALLDSYNDGLHVVSRVIEPLVLPAIERFGSWFGWNLVLAPHWLHLFVLCLIFMTAQVRTRRQESVRASGFVDIPFLFFGALIGCLLAGTVPPTGGWWAQGLIAGLPLFFAWFAMAAANLFPDEIGALLAEKPERPGLGFTVGYTGAAVFFGGLRAMRKLLIVTPPYFGLGFLLGAGLSIVPWLGERAGIAGLAAFCTFAGVHFLRTGLKRRSSYDLRLGLTLLGGFAAAGLLFLLSVLVALFT
ncbi:MAG: hypothetical protein AB7I04_24065 [Pseudomonadales bacterium]